MLATRQFVHARLDPGLTSLSLIVWAKTDAGMGGPYRSNASCDGAANTGYDVPTLLGATWKVR
ncbi:MAG: hypothetical protein ABSA66_13795 [Roseiarcus sp.]|jgi:hypothetical protein